MKTIITYGTFDLFHVGHVNLLERARSLGDRLVVGVSSDEFNAIKGKRSVFPYEHRARIVAALKCVDEVFPEQNWDQKPCDIARYGAHVFVMGHDWQGKFDDLAAGCEIVYLPRTDGISTTELKSALSSFNSAAVEELEKGLGILRSVVDQLSR